MSTAAHAHAAATIPPLLSVGTVMLGSFFAGKCTRFVRLPSIIGFMLVGVLAGPSALGLLSESLRQQMGFVTELALAFVALSIGLELSLHSLRQQGKGIVWAIFGESLAAFALVLAGVYLFTGDLVLALLFAGIAPASAPAGTVAVIQEYKASGSLTRALYAVVGFDDGLGIILFGFAAATARVLLARQTGGGDANFIAAMIPPLREVVLSVLVALAVAAMLCALLRQYDDKRSLFIICFATTLIAIGVCEALHLSLILTCMVVGMIVVNTQKADLVRRLGDRLTDLMPLLFVLFFSLAGAHLDLALLPGLGALGLVYIVCRSAGLMSGAWLGCTIGGLPPKIRDNLGMGILSQAGVAIGLALICDREFSAMGEAGRAVSTAVLTTITATCIIFELVGPVTTRIALTRAGEINATDHD